MEEHSAFILPIFCFLLKYWHCLSFARSFLKVIVPVCSNPQATLSDQNKGTYLFTSICKYRYLPSPLCHILAIRIVILDKGCVFEKKKFLFLLFLLTHLFGHNVSMLICMDFFFNLHKQLTIVPMILVSISVYSEQCMFQTMNVL